MKIGLVGEDPNDSNSIKNLLSTSTKYQHIQFKPLAQKVTGSKLKTEKLKNRLDVELSTTNFKYIIFIADLDDYDSDINKKMIKKDWFDKMNKLVNGRGIFLLNIHELEALILSDISNFNKVFGTKLKFTGNPMMQPKPKEYLMRNTAKHPRKFKVSDCPDIFAQLDINIVANKCGYFKEFLATFDKKLKNAA